MRKTARFAVCAAFVCGLAMLMAGWLGRSVILLDFANLVIVPAAILTLAAAIILAMRARGWAGRALPAIGAMVAAIALIPPGAAPQACPAEAERLRIAWLNTESVDDQETIMGWIEAEDPAVVALGELNASDEALRSALAARFPYRQSCLEHDRCSTAIYAKMSPLAAQGLARGDAANRRALSAAWMDLPPASSPAQPSAAPLRLMAVHLSHPAPLGTAGRQDSELAELQMAIRNPANTVIVGDFNATQRMHVLRRFASRNQLQPTIADRPTWPLNYGSSQPGDMQTLPLWQIDHVLAGRNWRVEALRTSDDLGSDHRGLVADLCRAN